MAVVLREAISPTLPSSSAKAGDPVRRGGCETACNNYGLWNTGSSAFADDDDGNRHCERSEAIHRAAYRPPLLAPLPRHCRQRAAFAIARVLVVDPVMRIDAI